jgi:hypothetical protein
MKGDKCSIDTCAGTVLAKGLCGKHYARLWRNGTIETIRPKGSKHGYINMIDDDGFWTLEHIYLAEKALGRKLPLGAQVHHMNGDRSDNYTPFNLIICPNQKYHALLHKRAKRCGL